MAFEGKGVFSRDFREVMDPDAPFNATNGESRRVREASDAASLKLERGLLPDVFSRLSGTVVGQHVSPGGPDHEQVVANVHGVDALGKVDSACER
jgi:hypothetical protein